MKIRAGGAWREITGAKIYANGAWRTIVSAKAYVSGAWRGVANFTSAMTVEASPLLGSTVDDSSTLTSRTFTATPTGGAAPYTYAWTIVSGTASIGSPTAASTTFTVTGMAYDESRDVTARCVVTDAIGSAATTNTVLISFQRTELSGGTS